VTHRHSIRAATVPLALLLVAASPVEAPHSEVLTLVSPNEQRDGSFGVSVAGAGDVDRDGFADVIVGAMQEADFSGRAYVFGGPSGALLFQLVSPHAESFGLFGNAVAGAGDVNDDGFDDVIVGAFEEGPGQLSDAGRAYVFAGPDGSLLHELISPNEEDSGLFGQAVAGAGDVNQDGFADLLVGAAREDPGVSPDGAGRAYLFSGRDGSVLFELVSPNEDEFGSFGSAVAAASDVDGDGIGDALVGASGENPGTSPLDSGRAYVFSGRSGALLLQLVSPNEEMFGFFGWSVGGPGDIDGDGHADLLVGAPLENPDGSPTDAGRAYVLSGQDGSLLIELVSPDEQSAAFAFALASAGDVDGDGSSDLIVGEGEFRPGRAFVFTGKDGTLLAELVSPNAQIGGEFGSAVGGAGDFDQDGLADLVVGARLEAPEPSPPGAGRAYVFSLTGTFRINSGGPDYTAIDGSQFVADRAYAPGGFGYVGGVARLFDQPIGGTDDDPLYQDVRLARRGNSDGIFSYRFDVSPGLYDVTLHLMAPELDGPGNVVMDVRSEEDVVFDDLDVTAEAGGAYQALVKTFTVDVSDGTLDLRFRAVNKAAVVSAIAVGPQTQAAVPRIARRVLGSER
jgi:hypothetical protein